MQQRAQKRIRRIKPYFRGVGSYGNHLAAKTGRVGPHKKVPSPIKPIFGGLC